MEVVNTLIKKNVYTGDIHDKCYGLSWCDLKKKCLAFFLWLSLRLSSETLKEQVSVTCLLPSQQGSEGQAGSTACTVICVSSTWPTDCIVHKHVTVSNYVEQFEVPAQTLAWACLTFGWLSMLNMHLSLANNELCNFEFRLEQCRRLLVWRLVSQSILSGLSVK